MHIESNRSNRGVSLAISEKVFHANRNLAVPMMNLQPVRATTFLQSRCDIKLDTANPPAEDKWEQKWFHLINIDSMIQGSLERSPQPYVKLLNDALAEVAKLEERKSSKKAMQLRKEALVAKSVLPPTPKKEVKPEIKKEVKVEPSMVKPNVEELNPREEKPTQQEQYAPSNVYTRQIDGYDESYSMLRTEYDAFVQNGNFNAKQARIDIAKRINNTLNKLAGTKKQVNQSFSNLEEIKNSCKGEQVLLNYFTFRVIESTLDCCNPGCQMYLNPKSVWPFAHLLRGLMEINSNSREVYYSMIKKRCPYIIPRLYQNEDQETLERLHRYSQRENRTYFKIQVALVRLHMALMVVTNDTVGLWAWFAGFLNACTRNVFKRPLAGVLMAALNTAAHVCMIKYKSQFAKILACCENMLKSAMLKAEDCESSTMYNVQLSLFFNDYRASGKIAEPEGFVLKEQEEELRRDI